MIKNDISVLLKKAEELRALFVLGQRVIPFLEEIFLFVSEIQPLLDEINVSIQDNLKKMPNASKQLSKVTEATEMATTEIMDIVDGLSFKTEIITNNLNAIVEANKNDVHAPIKLLETLLSAIVEGKDLKPHLGDIDSLIAHFKNITAQETIKLTNDTNDIIQSINMDAGSIMMSLQVQDITSQQIAAVNSLLRTVQSKLSKILNHFNNSELSDMVSAEFDDEINTNVSKLHREIAFDPDAVDSIKNKADRQSMVDDLVSQQGKTSEDSNETLSDEDIAAMFTGESESQPTKQDTGLDEPLSDADIAAMFGGGDDETVNNEPENSIEENDDDSDTEFSQDDIDKMFNS